VSTSTGLRKTITQYQGMQGRCRTCKRNYAPTPIRHTKKSKVYGDKLGAWLVYQRVGLRLPYESIIELFTEQFKEHISISSYDQKLWMRVEAAYPGDGPDHPPYKKEWIRHATRYRDSFSTSTAQR
jgi:hypothetical protein